MKKAKVFHAVINGTSTLIKAYKKANAVKRFQSFNADIRASDVSLSTSINSHQGVIEELYPELFN